MYRVVVGFAHVYIQYAKVYVRIPYISELKQGTNRSLVSFTSLVPTRNVAHVTCMLHAISCMFGETCMLLACFTHVG